MNHSATIEIVAHRGGAALAPENTLAAFRNALALGVDAVELDIHRSRDGALVVIHSAELSETTDGLGNVADHDLDYLRTLNAAAWYTRWPTRETIPTLDEVLSLIQGRARVQIEIKPAERNGHYSRYPGIAAAVVTTLRAHKMLQDALIISYDWQILPEIKHAAPEGAIGAIIAAESLARLPAPDNTSPLHALPTIHQLHLDSIHVADELVTPELVLAAHESGLRVGVWTVNEVARARELAAMGVDSITSDRPDLLLRTVRKHP
jgi:glycerophosphoryl diester phosphodiesterase